MLTAILLLCGTQSQAFSEIPEGYTVVPVSSAADVAAYLNTGSHAFTADSSLDLTGWTSTSASGGSAIFQVNGDMVVTATGSTRTTFFNGNTTNSSLSIENTGMFEMENGYIKAHTVSFSGNGSSSVYIHGSTSTSTGGAITQATTSSNSGSLVVENQASAVFSDNKASNGGVIYRKYGQLTFDNNKLLDFQNNTATSNGGAIYCATSATLEVTNNEVAVFSGNSATANGGAIYAQNSAAGTTLSNNGVLKITDNSAKQYGAAQFGTVLFDNNTVLDVSRNSSTSAGGAFYVGTQMTISNSQLVRFNDNKAQSQYATQAGGAIQTGSSGKIYIQNNGTVEFRNNLSSCTINNQKSTSITGNSHLIIAGNSGSNGAFAISGSGDTVNIDNNILVEITGNKASGNAAVISGGVATFCGNKELVFTGNDAGSLGGAIYNSVLTISGNDKVVFRNNTHVDSSGKTVLNSIYALEASLVLCATDKTDSITFYDTVRTEGTSGAIVSLNNGGAGRITFSGKYAEADLAARGGNYDVTASRTSVFGQALTVQGGVLEIADSAIIQTSGLSTSAGAAIELNSGTAQANVYIVSNSALNVSGSSSVTGQLYFYENADLNITLDASNLSNAALALGSSLAGSLSSVNFNLNSADLIDGKYKVMTGNGSAFANAEKGLSWEDGALYLTVSGNGNTWHVRNDFTYGEAVENSGSLAISLDGGTMHLTKGLAAGVTLASTASTTLELAAGVTLEASALSGLEHTMILSGEGVYNLGNSTAMNATLSNWKGQVRVGDGDNSYTTMTNLDLAGLGERGSSIRLQGVQGSLAAGEKTVEADVVLAAGNGIAAVVIDSATAEDSVLFTGAVSSEGAVNFINDAAVEHSYEFSGDVSGWQGQIVSNKGTLNLTYSGDARQIATDVRAADTGSGSVLNLKVQNAETVVFSGVVKDAATWNTKANRTLNVEIDNSGYETIFRNGVQADTVKLSNASTLVAQKENGTARVSVTAHKGAQAQLKAVDVTDTGLALHENNQNGETRGLMENAAVILGDDTAVAAFLTIDEASPVSAAASYAVSNIDFVNTTLTAMAGSGVTLSNVSFDAASAVKGDGSGMHLLAGQANVLTLANNPMQVDTQAGTITYTTTQLDGFTLAGGAGLLLDASALNLPAVAYGEYTMSIVLAGFTATDATPSVTITGQRWDSAGTVDYSWATGNVGLVATFTAMVPEPATSTLSLLALAALAARRRRK